MLARSCFFLMAAAAAMAQNGPHMRDWKPPASEKRSAPTTACGALVAQTGYEFTVVTATEMKASDKNPAYCRVLGMVQPEVRFEVSLPLEWNRRLILFGNGGYAGDNVEAPGPSGNRDFALGNGFVAARTNTGHDAQAEPLGSFAVNPQKLYDYSFRSLHVTTETAKRLARAYYGAAPQRSYYYGCSTGGRQGLILAQRFPNDFDGIVAGAPVLDFSGTMVQYTAISQAQAKAAIPFPKLKLLAERIYGMCDEKDGVKDGLIEDPRKCGFTPSRDLPKCAALDDVGCFTEGQIKTLETMYSPVAANGVARYPGWPVGAEIAGPNGRSGWDRWLIHEQAGETISHSFAESFFRYLAFPKKDPQLTLDQVDLPRDIPRLESIHATLDATNPDLTGCRARNGRLLMWFGWADPALNAQRAVDYYEEVRAKMGPSTPEFFRFYTIPGLFHCGGGVGCGSFDPLAAVIRWVEEGKAPERLITARVEGGKTLRTRPICPYPQVVKYKGTGSIDDAANFDCVAP
ncbi:MAG: tannase/feruloyl esterase family alpha/beta hydrolase [Acidobacteriota bacterium]